MSFFVSTLCYYPYFTSTVIVVAIYLYTLFGLIIKTLVLSFVFFIFFVTRKCTEWSKVVQYIIIVFSTHTHIDWAMNHINCKLKSMICLPRNFIYHFTTFQDWHYTRKLPKWNIFSVLPIDKTDSLNSLWHFSRIIFYSIAITVWLVWSSPLQHHYPI